MVKSAVPNVFTLSNLACGIMSIMMTFKASIDDPLNYKWACLFIMCAAFMDRYDGRVARYLDASSDIGRELDSLADLVSFGVAPSILVFNLYNFSNLGLIGYLLVLVFPIAGAYRLAKYNCSDFNGIFMGIPITIAGTLMALYSFITLNHTKSPAFAIVLLISFSYLMVSNVKFKKV